MEIIASSQPAANAPARSAKTAAISSDFETFLKMLTVQMQNQDPLNPADASDFAVQLATFSTVEQQVRTNEILTSLGAQLSGMGQLSGWVGMMARAQMPVSFDGTPVSLSFETPAGTDLARLVVRDMSGAIVQQMDAPTDGGEIIWNGLGEDGRLPSGLYRVEVDAFQGDVLLASRSVETTARIVEARHGEDGPILIMENGQQISAEEVKGLRAPVAG